jgi:hypothetical protein
MERLVRGLRLEGIAVPINLGDLFTVYARKPEESALPIESMEENGSAKSAG